MVRTKQVLYWTAPSLLCLLIYWYGFRAWFQMDDFAWLALHQKVADFPSFLGAMFRPYAQGTIRPWSERLFFLIGYWTFGLHAVPYRIAVFLTQFCNLLLLTHLTRRLTGSATAGFLAPILWIISGNAYQPLSWTSAYNQVLCATFVLSAFSLFLHYTQTSDRRFYWAQLAVFVLGFGALELNVVYAGIAFLYAICCARRFVLSTLPMLAISLLYTALNRALIRPDTSGVYKMVWDASILNTLGTYIRWTFSADRLPVSLGRDGTPFLLAGTVAGLVLLAFLLYQLWRRQWLALFLSGWYFGALVPFLPLKFHLTDYYLNLPIIGLAMLGAWGLAEAWRSGPAMRSVALAVALLYAVPNVWETRYYTRLNFDISRRVKGLVARTASAHALHPDKKIIFRGVDNDLFWTAIHDRPFQILGIGDIFLTEDTEAHIVQSPYTPISKHFLADAVALKLLNQNQAVVYQVGDGQLTNVTKIFGRMLAESGDKGLPAQIQAGSSAYEEQLGPGWFPTEQGRFRWMGKKASLVMRGPIAAHGTMTIRGHCPEPQVASGPVSLSVAINGKPFPASLIDASNLSFQFSYPVPDELVGAPKITILLEVDRTMRFPPDTRDVGLVFGEFEIRP